MVFIDMEMCSSISAINVMHLNSFGLMLFLKEMK